MRKVNGEVGSSMKVSSGAGEMQISGTGEMRESIAGGKAKRAWKVSLHWITVQKMIKGMATALRWPKIDRKN